MSSLARPTIAGHGPQSLPEAYATNADSAERAVQVPHQEMPADGVRQRHPQGPSTQVIGEIDTSARSDTSLTSNSNVLETPVEDSAPYMPRLAALQNSNESFCIFRRFGPSATRILLNKEIELDDITKRLDELDHADNEDPSKRYRLKGIEHLKGGDDKQQKLLQELEEKLNIYYDFLLKYSEVRSMRSASFGNHRSVHNYVVRNRPLYEKEALFLYDVDDFVSAERSGSQNTHSRIEKWLEAYISRRPRTFLHNFLKNSPEGRKSSNQLVHGFSNDRLAMLAKTFVAFLAMCTLFIPMLLMFLAELSRAKMACVLAIFVFVFMMMMSFLVDLTPHDFFIVVASYSAVLVGLLSNMTQAQ